MSKVEKVIIVDNSIGYTGALKSIYTTTTLLSDHFEFQWALPKGAVLNKLPNKTTIFRFIEIQKNWKLLFYLPILIFNSLKLVLLIKNERIKIVHVNDLYNMTGVLAKIIYPKFKLIYHIRLLPTSYVRTLYSYWTRIISIQADSIVCVSYAAFTHLPDKRKAKVIYDSIPDCQHYAPKEINNESENINILYLGNIMKGKGQDIALQAFAKALKRNNKMLLFFVGGNLSKKKNQSFLDNLKNEVEELNISKNVFFEEFNKDVEKTIKEADIVLNLSESESFSMVCLEALYYGTPLIASDCGGPRELFENGKSGILVPNKNIDAAAEAILRLAENYELRKSVSEEGKKYVRKKFDPVKLSHQLKNVYDDLLETD